MVDRLVHNMLMT